eukprot:TRINITY_DN33533_c0_g1_i1.p1 TRINITY_DN33533_c0_g1~~TRINITY_DN33533_c0_g1_i1.p1  ORF type:complete len:483 (-),score=85.27 TRINITY_DN33533_c0_g1_i1:27-1475(-)
MFTYTCCVRGEPIIGSIRCDAVTTGAATHFPEVDAIGEKGTNEDLLSVMQSMLGAYVAGSSILTPVMGTEAGRTPVATKYPTFLYEEEKEEKVYAEEQATTKDPVSVVQDMCRAYDAGKFFGTGREQAAAKFFSDDFSVDWSMPGKSCRALKVYETGPKAALDWFLSMRNNFVFNDFVREAFLAHGSGTVVVPISFTPESVATGKKAIHVEKEVQVWQVNGNGKISSCKVLFPDITMHAILSGEELPKAHLPNDDVVGATPDAARAVVQNMFEACAGGQLLGVATEFFSDDFIADWAVPGKSGTALKVYKAGANAALDWVLSMRHHVVLNDFAPEAFLAYGSGYVITPVSFLPESVTTGKKADRIEKQIQVWRVRNGKICHCKVYFNDTLMHDIISAELEVSVPLGDKPLGLWLDLSKPKALGLKIHAVKPTGAVAEYNKKAAKPVANDMTIREVLGVRGTAQELLNAIQGNTSSWVTMKLS